MTVVKDTLDDPGIDTMPRVAVPKPVAKARVRRRHGWLIFSFFLFVLGPVGLAGWYLFERAADQFASRVGFAVRAQDSVSPIDMFEGLGSVAGAQSSDTDILYEFIHSQDMVELVNETLDLRTLYSVPKLDPIFAFDADLPIEKLVKYWRRMVAVYYDAGTGLIELEVKAFSPGDAVAIAEEILTQSSVMINQLTAIARDDATGYARSELDAAVVRLKDARQALTRFRARTQIVDPSADVQGQMTVLVSLQQQLATTYVELDVLAQTSRENDPRVTNLRREVEVIENRIELERKKFGISGQGDGTYAALLGQFEELNVDLEFAQTTYLNALGSYDLAVREAQQQSRYLAAYLNPTRPQSAEFPQRMILLGLVALFAFLIWAILSLVYYSARDRG